MEEKEYIELQTLLAKLRVVCLKKMGDPAIIISERELNYKMVKNIDNIRKNMPLKIEEGTISN